MLNARKDLRIPGHSHWDDLIVEVRGGGVDPPDPPDPPSGTLGDLLGQLEIALIATQAALDEAKDVSVALVDYVDGASVVQRVLLV